MKDSEHYKDLLKILDNVLSYLVNSTENYNSPLEGVIVGVFKLEYKDHQVSCTNSSLDFEDLVKDIFSKFKNENNIQNKLILSIYHLKNNELIELHNNNVIQITFKGLMSYTEGFVREHQKQSDDKIRLLNVENFQRKISRQMLWVNCVIALGTLVLILDFLGKVFHTPCLLYTYLIVTLKSLI